MFILSKTYSISASHCIIGHSKCGRMHGHNYLIEVFIGGTELDDNGMLMDFGDLKQILTEVLEPFDHKHIGIIPVGWKSNPEHIITVPFDKTTAENLAMHWGNLIAEKISPLLLIQIDVYETPTSKASWKPDQQT